MHIFIDFTLLDMCIILSSTYSLIGFSGDLSDYRGVENPMPSITKILSLLPKQQLRQLSKQLLLLKLLLIWL